jgi:uncharacterized protein YdaU (DUF1376 family)
LSRCHPWSPFYWDDWATDTAHLTHLERSIYIQLLTHYYKSQKPLLANATALPRLCQAVGDDEVTAMLSVLAEFFELREDGYHNKRADKELARSVSISKIRADVGRAGGLANATNLPKQKATHPHPHPHIHKPKSKSIVQIKPSLEDVQAYCRERGNTVSPEAWFDYYSANGWHVGRNPMKDWKATVRYWERKGNTNDGGRYAERQVSKNDERIAKNREAILIGLGFVEEIGRSESDLQNPDAAGGNPGLAAGTYRAKSRSN